MSINNIMTRACFYNPDKTLWGKVGNSYVIFWINQKVLLLMIWQTLIKTSYSDLIIHGLSPVVCFACFNNNQSQDYLRIGLSFTVKKKKKWFCFERTVEVNFVFRVIPQNLKTNSTYFRYRLTYPHIASCESSPTFR